MDYLKFKRWFDENAIALDCPSDCTELSPAAFQYTNLHLWSLEWILFFDDGKYLRIWEHYDKVKGLEQSRRLQFSYHYGPLVGKDSVGQPVYLSSDPVDIRIDNHKGETHLHFQAPNPHYPLKRIKGRSIESLDLFTFIKAIFSHRKSGKSIDKVLGFKIAK